MKSLALLATLFTFSAAAENPCGKFLDPLPENVQRDSLWKRILSEKYATLPALDQKERVINPNPLQTNKDLMELRIRAFDVEGDVRPVQDHKMTHINGPAALVKVRFSKSPFTGFFSEGERVALMRGSFAFNPKQGKPQHDFPQPGLALKFFVTGSSSLNILAMGSLDGESSDGRFFSTPMATKLAAAQTLRGKLGEKAFSGSTVNPGHLKLNHLARRKPDGGQVTAPMTPEWIVFTPTEEARSFGDKTQLDFRQELLKIPVGTKIYSIKAAQKNSDGREVLIDIGEVETSSEFVASAFADKKLHFRHEGANPSAGYLDYLKWHCGE